MKVKVLDGLRGYAVLLIVLAHLPYISNSVFAEYLSLFIRNFKISYLGVDLFFVLSGFLITRILIKEKAENRFSFKRFYLKRVLRIFPIYYIVIILSGILFTWKGIAYIAPYLSNYYFSFNIGPHPLRHVWSLAVEEHFYLIWPLLIYLFSLNTAKKVILIIIPILITLSLCYNYTFYDIDSANQLILRASQFRILSIAIGSFFAFIEPKIRTLSKINTILTLVIFFLSYSLTVILYKLVAIKIVPLPLLFLVLFSITSSSLFLYILQFEKKKSLINYLFTNKFIRYIGLISYGIYLYHFPILYFFGITQNQLGAGLVPFDQLLIPLLLIFLIPSISYFAIEKPLLNFKEKINKL